MLVASVGCNNAAKPTCDEQAAIDPGHFKSDWSYENTTLGLSMELPDTMFLLSYLGPYQMPVQIKDSLLDGLNFGQQMSIATIRAQKNDHDPFPMINLFRLSFRTAHPEWVNVLGSGVVFRLAPADGKDADRLLKELKQMIQSPSVADIEIPFGKEEIKGIVVHFSHEGIEGNKLIAIKQFGCLHLVVGIDYVSKAELDTIKTWLQKISLN